VSHETHGTADRSQVLEAVEQANAAAADLGAGGAGKDTLAGWTIDRPRPRGIATMADTQGGFGPCDEVRL